MDPVEDRAAFVSGLIEIEERASTSLKYFEVPSLAVLVLASIP